MSGVAGTGAKLCIENIEHTVVGLGQYPSIFIFKFSGRFPRPNFPPLSPESTLFFSASYPIHTASCPSGSCPQSWPIIITIPLSCPLSPPPFSHSTPHPTYDAYSYQPNQPRNHHRHNTDSCSWKASLETSWSVAVWWVVDMRWVWIGRQNI